MRDERRLMTPAEVAELLGLSPLTLEDWRKQRRGPAYVKVGKLVRYKPAAVAAWIDGQTTETETRP